MNVGQGGLVNTPRIVTMGSQAASMSVNAPERSKSTQLTESSRYNMIIKKASTINESALPAGRPIDNSPLTPQFEKTKVDATNNNKPQNQSKFNIRLAIN